MLHPTSLPSSLGIGTLGDEAKRFVDLLASAHISLWQMLPLGPTGYGDSPYAARSTFAGNELLVDLKTLAYDGYLEITDVLNPPSFDSYRIDYGVVRAFKMPLLYKAADTFLATASAADKAKYQQFCSAEGYWLDDYALYVALCDAYGDSRWFSQWPEELKMRHPQAVEKATKQYRKEIERTKVIQFFFASQLASLISYAHANGVSLVGDIPIFVAGDSVDVWTNRSLFKLDAEGNQTASSGVPPDAFSADGQLWGNPLYDWPEHEKTHFAWWTARLKHVLSTCDIVRIDHFRGFSAYWEVPAGEKTAIHGSWVAAPGQKLFDHLHKVFGAQMPVIAEDLGVITPDVEELRDGNGFPGMKVLQFAFGLDGQGRLDSTNAYLPHNCTERSVIYTGTHDNNTTQGWYDTLDGAVKDKVRRYLECPDDQVVWQMVRAALMSVCQDAIFPMQDWLGLGADARMNVPATCGTSNWSWRLDSLDVPSWRVDRLRDMVDLYGRQPATRS